MTLACPVKDCQRTKPGENYIMCKPCWRGLPKPVRDQWRAALKELKPPGGWTKRVEEIGGTAALKLIENYKRAVGRCILAAYKEPIGKEPA